MKLLKENWERVIFTVIGLSILSFSFRHLLDGATAEAATTFGMGFFSLIFASLARFKRFRGLGFEAELWEDKQREAEELIERLQGIFSIYARETVLGRVMNGRWASEAGDWEENWRLFEEVQGQHSELGQKIDFSDLKAELDAIFLFDIVSRLTPVLSKAIRAAHHDAQQIISSEFGSPITDIEGHNHRLKQLREVVIDPPKDAFNRAKDEDLAAEILEWSSNAKDALANNFGIELTLDAEILSHLSEVSRVSQDRPIKVTKKLIELSQRTAKY